jgi:hypothetical protein
MSRLRRSNAQTANVSKREVSTMTAPKADLPQGVLDMLILKTVMNGPIHGYAIAQRQRRECGVLAIKPWA